MPTFTTTLAAAVDDKKPEIQVTAAGASVGDCLQIGEELLVVERVKNNTNPIGIAKILLDVKRGAFGSVAAAHLINADVTEVVPSVQTGDPVDPPEESPGGGGADAHIADATAAHAASAIGFTPAAGLAATNVQGAIEEEVADRNTAIAAFAQPLDSDLTAIAALVSAANKLPYATGAGTWSLADLSAFARTILDDADAATALATIGGQALHANLTALAGLALIADRLPYANGSGTLALATLTAAGRALLDDADAAAQLTTLGVSAFIQTLLNDADAAAARATLGVVPPTTLSAIPAADVTLAATYTDIASIELAAGTYLAWAHATILTSSVSAVVDLRLNDGTDNYGSGEGINNTGRRLTMAIVGIPFTLGATRTLKLQGADNGGTGVAYKVMPLGPSAGDTASVLTVLKIA